MPDDEKGYVQPEHKLILRPVVGLTENLPTSDLEQITIQAIKGHRLLRDLAEARQDEWHAIDSSAKAARLAHIAYVTAMIDMHAQQTVLSTLLDVLGYIPFVPGD